MNRTMICGMVFLLALAAGSAHAQAVKGTGTGGTIPVWTSTSTIGNSVLTQSGGNVSNATGNVAGKQLVSTATGIAPLVVSSSTQVTNLNASFLGGFGPGGFIQNTMSPTQTGANFNIDGSGTLGGTLSAGTVNSAGTYQIGGSAVLSVTNPIIGNLFVGIGAGAPNTTGDFSTAVGTNALSGGSTGTGNTAIGIDTLQENTTGFLNTAIGSGALGSNSQGFQNTASGSSSLANTTGSENVGDGALTLQLNGTGSGNTAIGNIALQVLGNINATNNTPASNNTAVGNVAGANLTVGKFNVLLGAFAGINFFNSGESMNIDIGNLGVAGESGVIRIGTDVKLVPSCANFPGCHVATFIAGINGVTTGLSPASTVLIDSNGQLGTMASSRRYKEDIHDMGAASDGLLRLRPVTFRYKKAFDDGSKPLQYGLVAEEVAEVYPELVVRGKDGQVETVQYYKLDAMLLNEIQKLAKAHAADQAEIAQLRSQVADQLNQGQEQQAAIRQLLDRVSVIQAALAATSGPKATPAEVAAKY